MQRLIFGKRTRDERGAYAVLFALLVIMLLTVAALAVDIGNGTARKSDVQGQADFAALAGGRELGTETSGTVPTVVVNAVRDFLNQNHPLDQDCSGDCVVSSQLTDGQFPNGEVLFDNGGLRVYTPEERVDFGFARVIGYDSIDVQGDATVGVFSPGGGAIPMYASDGCDFGRQTLTDPASGLVDEGPDNLFNPPGGTNDTTVTGIFTPNPPQIPVADPAAPGPILGVTGTKFYKDNGGAADNPNPDDRVTKIGFFLDDGVTWYAQPTDPADWTDPVTTNNANSVRVLQIPAEVASHEGVWWVRVFKKTDGEADSTGAWSAESDAEPLQVGSSALECDAGASSGNFGTLRLPRTDVPVADNLATNVVKSFEDPLTLVTHATDADGRCDGDAGAVISDEPDNLQPSTNCAYTDPGLPATAATQGLVTGVGSVHGRLNGSDHPTNPDCGRTNYSLTFGRTSYSVNNDTLSCFLTDTGNLSSIMSESYSGGARLSNDIYDSPRFFWLPVVSNAPTDGTKPYWIIDFRPGFFTDETAVATKSVSDATSANGLTTNNNKIDQVKVVFFNKNALPGTTNGPVGDYLGTGPKILRMID